MNKHKIAVIGVGKIAIDQHLPVIDKSPDFEVVATVSTRGVSHRDLPAYRTGAELYAAHPKLELVAICTPPGARHPLVREALDAGKHVLMEKPPTTTLAELDDLVTHAKKRKRVLFQTWHSRYNEAVEAVRKLLKRDGVKEARIDWRENVRKWHPGQDWVWEPGGYGVCDPGINALSIFTRVMPFPVFIEKSTLKYPANRQTPVDTEIIFKSTMGHQPSLSAGFNWLEETGEIWTQRFRTQRDDELLLENGGATLKVNGRTVIDNPIAEYERIYEHFAKLLKKGKSDVDVAPIRLISDAFLLGARQNIEEFHW